MNASQNSGTLISGVADAGICTSAPLGVPTTYARRFLKKWLYRPGSQIGFSLALYVYPAARTAAASVGAIRDFQIADRVTFGIGALYSHNFLPNVLEPSYGGDPDGAMGFVRLKFNG